jgi:hypothetical protein
LRLRLRKAPGPRAPYTPCGCQELPSVIAPCSFFAPESLLCRRRASDAGASRLRPLPYNPNAP